MTREMKQLSFQPRRAFALFFLIFCVPLVIVTMLDLRGGSAFPAMARSSAIIGIGLGGYSILFLLLVFVLPEILKELGRAELSRGLKCAAFSASIGSSMLTIILTVSKVPVGSMGVRLAVAVILASAVYGALLWAKKRSFDELCGWPHWTWRSPPK